LATRREHLSIGGALGWFVASYGVALVGYLAVNAIAGRFLGRDLFGYFVLAMTTAAIAGQLALVGVHRSGLREAAKLRDKQLAGATLDAPEDLQQLQRLVGGARAVSLVSLPIAAVVCGGVAVALVHQLVEGLEVGLSLAVMVWLAGEQILVSQYLRGFGRVRLASLLEGRSGGALVAGLQAVALGLVWRVWPATGLVGAFTAVSLGYVVPVLLGRIALREVFAAGRADRSLVADLRFTLHNDWRFASNQLATYLNTTTELWVASAILASASVSLFGAATRLAMTLMIPMTSLQVVFAPVVARMLATGEHRRLERVLRSGTSMATLASALLWVPMLLVPGVLLTTLFGRQFHGAATVLVLLTLGILPSVVTGNSGTVLTMSHHEGTMATVQWVTVGVRTVGAVIAGTLVGLTGLGVSSAVATALLGVGSWWLAHDKTGVWTQLTLRPELRLLRRTRG
jgi:O-antigen/teichoic acid export membrane protein